MSSRGRRDGARPLRSIEPTESIDPQSERQQGPQQLTVIARAGSVLAYERCDPIALEVALSKERAALQLLLELRRERAAQPLSRRDSECLLAVASDPAARTQLLGQHLTHERLTTRTQVDGSVYRCRELGELSV